MTTLFNQPPDNGTATSKAAAKAVPDAARLRACVLAAAVIVRVKGGES